MFQSLLFSNFCFKNNKKLSFLIKNILFYISLLVSCNTFAAGVILLSDSRTLSASGNQCGGLIVNRVGEPAFECFVGVGRNRVTSSAPRSSAINPLVSTWDESLPIPGAFGEDVEVIERFGLGPFDNRFIDNEFLQGLSPGNIEAQTFFSEDRFETHIDVRSNVLSDPSIVFPLQSSVGANLFVEFMVTEQTPFQLDVSFSRLLGELEDFSVSLLEQDYQIFSAQPEQELSSAIQGILLPFRVYQLSVNLDASFSDDFEISGDVFFTTSHEVSQVPLPAAAWFFMSAIAGLLGFRKLNKSTQ